MSRKTAQSLWLNGNGDYRKGLNDAVVELTGYSLEEIAEHLVEEAA